MSVSDVIFTVIYVILALILLAMGLWPGPILGRFSRTDRLIRSQVRTRVLVTMLDGTAFRGALDATDAHSLVLLDAEMLAAGGERAVKANGRMILPREQVSYIQVI